MNWKKTHLFLYTFCRYFLATMIISYAFAKLFETQFVSQPSVYDKPIGTLNGFQLTWYYYGYSYWYGMVIAVTQIISALLLFFRRTTRIGIVLFLTFMVNILLVDFAYNIEGAKGMALTLTLMAIFVFLSDYKNLLKYFLAEPPLFSDEERPKWHIKLNKVKFAYIPLVFIGFFLLLTALKQKYMAKNQFSGTWENVENADRLYFEAANTFQINKQFANSSYVNGEYRFTKDSLILKRSGKEKKVVADSTHLYSGKYQLKGNELMVISGGKNTIFKKIR